eukprot:symbB.v1.2.001712.t1/scaffold61.1/size362833/11
MFFLHISLPPFFVDWTFLGTKLTFTWARDGVRPAKLVEGFVASPAKKDVSFTATTPPSSQELSSSFVTPSSRSSSSTPELRSYRLTEGRCEALDSVHPWALDLEDKEVKTPVHEAMG